MKQEKRMSLKQMQEIVGGYIEFTTATDAKTGERVALCVNEDGLSLRLKPNPFLHGVVGNAIRGKIVAGAEGDDFVGH